MLHSIDANIFGIVHKASTLAGPIVVWTTLLRSHKVANVIVKNAIKIAIFATGRRAILRG
jgi:hypothetical protein